MIGVLNERNDGKDGNKSTPTIDEHTIFPSSFPHNILCSNAARFTFLHHISSKTISK